MHGMRGALIIWIAATLLRATQAQPPQTSPEASDLNSSAVTAAPHKRMPREIILQNLAPFDRRQPVAVVVPFAQGVAHEMPELTVDDLHTVWEPFGGRWPDGSWRQALCMFLADVPRLSEVRLPLLAGIATLTEEPIAMPAAKITFVVTQGQHAYRVEPVPVRTLEKNAMRRVEVRRARIGKSGLVAELIVTAWRNQRHADVSLAVFYSDPTNEAPTYAIDELAVECQNMGIVLRHPGYLGIAQTLMPHGSRTVLLRQSYMAKGQGLRRVGVIVPPLDENGWSNDTLRASAIVPLLVATSWRHTDAFGPFGTAPSPPPWLAGDALRSHFAKRHKIFVQGEQRGGAPFGNGPYGSWGTAARNQDQPDFGVCKLSPVAFSGIPSMLLEIEPSILQEACRPVHFFDSDGSPSDPAGYPANADPAQAPHGWRKKDPEQWSTNHLAAYALLTGSHWARLELENEARLFLAHHTANAPPNTPKQSTPLGDGRVALAMAWNLCVSGNAELRAAMDERIERIGMQWAGKEISPDGVRPMAVRRPNAQWLGGKHPCWNPWEDAMAAIGFASQHRMTNNLLARQLAEALATNVVRHGWLLEHGKSEVAVAMRWQDGTPLTNAQLRSPNEGQVEWAFGSPFSEWAIGAVEIARVTAERDGDTALAKKAKAIQHIKRSERRRPPDNYPELGGFDRFGEWDAVVWSSK